MHHKKEALESMKRMKYPVKYLSFYVRTIDDNVINHVSALGSELLSLDIFYSKGLVVINVVILKLLLI